ncbi:MAG: flagellar basal body rod protein FlgC [Ignavibacteriae bacterium HGW-Ignavibacteriae-2]|jgi:flagellar basal-body rod protein FlgC|nr:flagellar basal body rod protein FlgC [Bacteroidota bacterium]PKL87420.1 MAG: flagellar basal body rod protein FlgC [Ignavibacteriae bacterium HGW-Ignavibacteriae-2]
MKVGNHIPGFNISAKGLSVQRKRMNLIAENIANAENTRTETGDPYKRKFMVVTNKNDQLTPNSNGVGEVLSLRTSSVEHIRGGNNLSSVFSIPKADSNLEVLEDTKEGEMLYMPNHPNADEKGYVQMSNVNIVQEMVEMIAASRSYEANITALNASKEMAKDSLEI